MEPVPGNVLIVHDGIGAGSLSQVPQTSLAQHYRAGWRLAGPDDIPKPPPPEPDLEPETKQSARASAAKASKDEGDK